MKQIVARRAKRQSRKRTARRPKPVRPQQQPASPPSPQHARFVSRLPSRSALRTTDFVGAVDVLDEPKPTFLVDGLLFPGSPFSMFGQPGSGKSLIALYLAVSVAARRPFVDRAVNLG
jgi:hypothetical protein